MEDTSRSRAIGRRQFLRAMAVTASAVTLLGACAPAATPTATAPQPAAPSAPMSPAAPPVATAVPATSVATTKRGGTVTIAVETFGQEGWLGHISTTSNTGPQQPLFEHLLYYDLEDPFVLTPGLAGSWSTKEMKEWTFKVREGARWGKDQGEVTAEDVAYTFQLYGSAEAKNPSTPYIRPRIDKMKLVDKYTLKFTLDTIDSAFAYELSPWRGVVIYCKKYLEAVGVDGFNKAPLGSGPYRLVKEVPGSRIELQAVDWPHWRVQPKWDNMVFVNMPENTTRLALLGTGRADLVVITAEQVAEAKKQGYTLFPSKITGMLSIMFGGLFTRDHPEYQGKDPWQDIRVREAMNIAIDRKAINETFFSNLGTYEPAQGNNVAPLSTVAQLAIPYDPQKAKRLLSEAKADGFSPQIISFTYPGIPQTPDVMQAVASYWEAVGLKPKITPMDRMAFREFWLTDKTNGMLWPWANPVLPTYQARFEKFYWSKDIGFNIYTDAYLDAAYEKLITTSDPAVADKLLADAQVYTRQQWGAIHLLNVPSRIFAANPRKVGSWNPVGGSGWASWEYVAPQ